MPSSPGGSRLPSSSKIASSLIGQALPTVPGFYSESSAVAKAPPPSLAA
ncbi:hypothetical protein SALBM311S_07397 [Streptomyces alboniger]